MGEVIQQLPRPEAWDAIRADGRGRQARVARNVNELEAEHLTIGQRVADAVAHLVGSWWFLGAQPLALAVWVVLNSLGWARTWDPYPFILLNLALSFRAAYSAPVIMMSQNRQAAKDRFTAVADFAVNRHAELEIAAVQARLDDLAGQQWEALPDLQRQQVELLNRIEALTVELQRATTGG